MAEIDVWLVLGSLREKEAEEAPCSNSSEQEEVVDIVELLTGVLLYQCSSHIY